MFFVSQPLTLLLNKAAVAPARLNRALDVRFRHDLGAMDWRDHFPRMLSRAGNTSVTRLRRLNRYIFLETNCRGVRYFESRYDSCTLICAGALPETILIAAQGRVLGDIVDLGPVHNIYEGLKIEAASEIWPGAIMFELQPTWQRYK